MNELRGLYAPIDGQVGDIINGQREIPSNGITIFHSMGRLTFNSYFWDISIIREMNFSATNTMWIFNRPIWGESGKWR